jgi:hypothetical protein
MTYVNKKVKGGVQMIFSISEYLGFNDEEVLKIFREEDFEITAIREPSEFQQAFPVQQN